MLTSEKRPGPLLRPPLTLRARSMASWIGVWASSASMPASGSVEE